MARPKKAVVDYFPHFVSSGKSLYTLEAKYGNNGYAFWFKILELLGSTENHFLDCNLIETWEFVLAKTSSNEQSATDILDLLMRLGSIDRDLWEKKLIWSSNFVSNLDVVYRRREVSAYTKKQLLDYCNQKYPLSGVSVYINPQSKVKESKVKESKVCTKKSYKFKRFDEQKTFKTNTLSNPFQDFLDGGFEQQLIDEALARSKGKDSPMSYAKGILRNWKDTGVKTLEALRAKEKKTKKVDKPTYQNFEQREYGEDEYDKFYFKPEKE